MNKHSIITAVAIVVIAIPLIYSGSSIVEAQQLEYRWYNPGEFTFFTMSNDGEIKFCNTLPFWTSFQKFEIEAFYQIQILKSGL
jgi:hypothetical protein